MGQWLFGVFGSCYVTCNLWLALQVARIAVYVGYEDLEPCDPNFTGAAQFTQVRPPNQPLEFHIWPGVGHFS